VDFRKLVVWQKAMTLAEEVYKATKDFPKEEIYGLTSQMKRAAVSVCSNIAEGQARGKKEFIHFLKISDGSLAELKTQIELADRLKFLTEFQYKKLLEMSNEMGKLLGCTLSHLEPDAY
jgi:four helix bundle protein